ncbi:MAG: SDR family NAD(P)-dependent oxidoreductase [Chloroflexi bacterium]|nr:SDR family NAD(P)-dependent oxidoreductase [Chloroflexota bacterium]MDA1147199.1 SDR family NAD(P)-dependent oxidoreductase [Chloroflexota bacterium]
MTVEDARPVCVIVGVGPGTGAALVSRFASAYRIAMIARSADRLEALAGEVDGAFAYPCDVADGAAFVTTLGRIRDELGAPAIAIHNPVVGAWGTYDQLDPAVLAESLATNVMSLLHLAQQLVPAMVEAGDGVLLCTGSTGAYEGSVQMTGYAPSRAAQRTLAESIAKSVAPDGVHVAYLVIDGVIDTPPMRRFYPDAEDDFFMQPDVIAEECWRLAHQPRSAWSFRAEIRPAHRHW